MSAYNAQKPLGSCGSARDLLGRLYSIAPNSGWWRGVLLAQLSPLGLSTDRCPRYDLKKSLIKMALYHVSYMLVFSCSTWNPTGQHLDPIQVEWNQFLNRLKHSSGKNTFLDHLQIPRHFPGGWLSCVPALRSLYLVLPLWEPICCSLPFSTQYHNNQLWILMATRCQGPIFNKKWNVLKT